LALSRLTVPCPEQGQLPIDLRVGYCPDIDIIARIHVNTVGELLAHANERVTIAG